MFESSESEIFQVGILSSISLEKDSIVDNAKSIMGVITMAAGYNTTITLKVEGSDEQDAANAIEKLFEGKFEED